MIIFNGQIRNFGVLPFIPTAEQRNRIHEEVMANLIIGDYRDDETYKKLLLWVCENPGDDLPRFALRDWLIEHGGCDEAYKRADEITRGLAEPTKISYRWSTQRWSIRRGFVYRWDCTMEQFYHHAAEIVLQHPIEEWVITDMEPSVTNSLSQACFHVARKWAGLLPIDPPRYPVSGN